ncbi:fimbrial protein [Serratia sp. NPDC078593]|uniref:fimbrial protein n=1 Tax=unclassified Serratia (in: enterobacteria) TaxID=2647522 RepID=UPI0037D5AB6D
MLILFSVPRILIVFSLMMPCLVLQAEDNLHFSGTLVAEPCTVHPDDETIDLDFGNVVDKYLYINQRTIGKAFAIRLLECDISLGELVEITLQGVESSKLPGLFALNAGSEAQGVAIGIESVSGESVAVNQAYRRKLIKGGNSFNLQAYVRAEPDAIKNRMIRLGSFSAVSTFLIDYP